MTDPSQAKGKWARSQYGSAPATLAFNGSLVFEPMDGNPAAGSLKASSPFSNLVGTERLSLVYNISPYNDAVDVADLTGRVLTAKVRLVTSPNTNCTYVAAAWSTSDLLLMGTDFTQVKSATPPTLTVGDWLTASFDLDLSANVKRINQVGIDITSTCTGTAVGTGNTVFEVDHVTLGCK